MEKPQSELEGILRKSVNKLVGDFRKKHRIADSILLGAPLNYREPTGENLLQEIGMLQFGVRCIMAQGGYRMKPIGMTDTEIKKRSDEEMTRIVNNHIMLKAAEKILLRAGLRQDYIDAIAELGKAVDEAAKPKVKTGEALTDLAKTLAARAAEKDGNGRGET